MDNLNLIEKYLSEELSTSELVEFDRLMKDNAAFAEEVQLAVTLNANFKVQQKLRFQKLLKEQTLIVKETPIRQLPKRQLPLRRLRSIAAIFVLGLAVAFSWMIFGGADNNALADTRLATKYENPIATRTEDIGIDSNWKNAIQAYKDNRFSTAVAAIERSLERDSENADEKHFYLGLSYLYQKVPDLEKAISHLEKSKELNAVNYEQQANWFMSLAFLKQDKTEEAKMLLQKLVDADDWKSEEAAALLNEF